jgi:hypothetical protein
MIHQPNSWSDFYKFLAMSDLYSEELKDENATVGIKVKLNIRLVFINKNST